MLDARACAVIADEEQTPLVITHNHSWVWESFRCPGLRAGERKPRPLSVCQVATQTGGLPSPSALPIARVGKTPRCPQPPRLVAARLPRRPPPRLKPSQRGGLRSSVGRGAGRSSRAGAQIAVVPGVVDLRRASCFLSDPRSQAHQGPRAPEIGHCPRRSDWAHLAVVLRSGDQRTVD